MPALSEDISDSPTALRRKREIAMAARTELLEKGVEGLRMRSVAARCGINIATLDYHAGGKDGLVALVARSLVEDFRARHQQTDRTGMTGLQELAQELRDFRAVRLNTPDIHPIMAMLARRASNEPAIAQHILPMKGSLDRRIEDIMRRGRSDGSLRHNLDPAAAARVFIWSILSLGSPEQGALDFPQHATEILRAFAAGEVDPSTGQLS